MNDSFYVWLMLIFILAGVVKGITGMGLPTVAMGLLGTLISVPMAASLLVIPSLVTNLWQAWCGPAVFPLFKKLWSMMLFSAFSTLIAMVFLTQMNSAWARFALGCALIVYAMYSLVAPKLSVSRRAEQWLSPVIGLLTGLITGITGVFVIPAVPYLQALDLNKDELIQALGLSFTVSTLALAIGLSLQHQFDVGKISLSIFVLIPALLGMWLGQKIRHKMNPQRFKQFFFAFLMLLGLQLMFNSFGQ